MTLYEYCAIAAVIILILAFLPRILLTLFIVAMFVFGALAFIVSMMLIVLEPVYNGLKNLSCYVRGHGRFCRMPSGRGKCRYNL